MVQKTSSAENQSTQKVLGMEKFFANKILTEAIILTFHLDIISNLEVGSILRNASAGASEGPLVAMVLCIPLRCAL